jgi:membrane protease YdiL (CAAX protease family)
MNALDFYYYRNIAINFVFILLIPICEEILFRGLIQDLILKQLGTYILNTTVPQYVSQEEDSIWNSIGRIALTSYLFSYIHEYNRAELGDDLTNRQRKQTLILGFVCGCLKDYFGLSSAIGAHIFNNLYSITVSFLRLRDTKVD